MKILIAAAVTAALLAAGGAQAQTATFNANGSLGNGETLTGTLGFDKVTGNLVSAALKLLGPLVDNLNFIIADSVKNEVHVADAAGPALTGYNVTFSLVPGTDFNTYAGGKVASSLFFQGDSNTQFATTLSSAAVVPPATAVPEPGTVGLLVTGLIGLGMAIAGTRAMDRRVSYRPTGV